MENSNKTLSFWYICTARTFLWTQEEFLSLLLFYITSTFSIVQWNLYINGLVYVQGNRFLKRFLLHGSARCNIEDINLLEEKGQKCLHLECLKEEHWHPDFKKTMSLLSFQYLIHHDILYLTKATPGKQ